MSENSRKSVKIGISSCLLGEKVRFDGEGKRQRWVTDEFSKVAEFVSICPEMAMGLGAPRESIRIRKDSETKTMSLVTSRSKEDQTDLANKTIRHLFDNHIDQSLDGYILMANSPLCGLSHVKVYESKNDIPHKSGQGFFAKELEARYPLLPMTEHGRLSDPAQREAFLTHVFLYRSLKDVSDSPKEFQTFHRSHKFLLMSYHPANYRRLGRIVAESSKENIASAKQSYLHLLADTFRRPRHPKRGTDALLHMMGFFKNQLNSDQKQHMLSKIEDYKTGKVPFSVPLSMLSLVNAGSLNTYIVEQSIFQPYPAVLR